MSSKTDAMLAHDPENWSRTMGLIAVLSLPARTMPNRTQAKPVVQIEVQPDEWLPVDTVVIDSDAIVFLHGTNGTRREHRFEHDRCPRWRVVREEQRHGFAP